MDVKQIIDGIIGREGDYVNDANDRGGATKYGITEATARKYGYTGDMKYLPRDKAFDIYLQGYWKEPGFDRVAQLSQPIAEELCDTAVNMGTSTSVRMLQRALNVLNRQQKDYPDIAVDGGIGNGTLLSLAKFLAKRGAPGEIVLLKTLNILQGIRYIEISEARQANEEFFFGWIAGRVNL